jgi:hypothetical protein
LSNTYWAPYYDVESSLYASGYYSFAYADLSHCLTLDLSHSSFALSDEVASSYVYVYTADNTFFGANLSNLISLNLSNVIFANVGIAQYDLFTASNTFNSANLSSLSMLDLSNDVFACSNMTSKDVYTAYNTFLGADLSNLNSLNFGRAIFAANNMTTQNAYSAYNTFAYANFSHFNTLVTNDIRIGNDNSGLNTINSNCFNNIIRNVD